MYLFIKFATIVYILSSRFAACVVSIVVVIHILCILGLRPCDQYLIPCIVNTLSDSSMRLAQFYYIIKSDERSPE